MDHISVNAKSDCTGTLVALINYIVELYEVSVEGVFAVDGLSFQ
jgi:hypothetical protein